jgi:hypothetical protein
MKLKKSHIVFLIAAGLVACVASKDINQDIFIGHFQETNYSFMESFQHSVDEDSYLNLPYDLKFGGIRPFPYGSIGTKDYSWLRNKENLVIAFNTVKSIGLDKFVSYEKYNSPNNKWCCDTQWENKSLNDIVKEFIASDTSEINDGYFSKFWQRRRKENNLKTSLEIFKQIDLIYKEGEIEVKTIEVDSVMRGLLERDRKLSIADSSTYKNIALEYFNYLNFVELEYSAYKLLFHNEKIKLTQEIRDSIILTMNCDTLSEENWKKMDDNRYGWMRSIDYPDPKRYYGP